jgi:hypothetical protein
MKFHVDCGVDLVSASVYCFAFGSDFTVTSSPKPLRKLGFLLFIASFAHPKEST